VGHGELGEFLDMRDKVTTWMTRDPDPQTRAELQALLDANDEGVLAERFAARLAFGTAGLRGVVGAGPARMNRLVVRETSAGLGTYLLSVHADAAQRGVVIGYDGRLDSQQFADDVVGTLTALGIRVHIFEDVTPTPVCAFAVTHVGAAAGIVITASHNPPAYNGYKVYWGNGAQIIAPHDAGIAQAIERAAVETLPFLEPSERSDEHVAILGDELYEAYFQSIAGLSVHPTTASRTSLALAYTPLHGVGARTVETALKRAGFETLHVVPSQREPDGHFPTVNFPNPEEPGAMDAVIALAKDVGAPCLLYTSPSPRDRTRSRMPSSA